MTADEPVPSSVASSATRAPAAHSAVLQAALHSVEAELQDLRERMGIVEAVSELGVIEYEALTQLLHLDAGAATLHAVDASAGPMTLESWVALLAEEDRLRAHALLRSGVPEGQTERMTVRLPGIDPRKPRLLELALRAAPRGQRLIGTCRDVTRERSLEALRRQKAAAERANQAKSEFMSQVSHELRTPLNAILGFAQLMAMDTGHPLHSVQNERLQMVQHSGRRLLGLIDQLLQIGRIEQGRRSLRPRPVNVFVLVGRCVDALRIMASERGIAIEVDVERSERSAVRADPQALEQVLANLLSNAIKYNREQGRVRVRFFAGDRGELTVEDTGKGLSESQIGRLFEPFNRLDAEKSAVPGTGLGLVITKQLVEAMGGSLHVRSQLDHGSRFTVVLPLARRARDTATEALPLEFPSQWDTGREYRVLYIEDDEVNQVLMEQVFTTQPDWRLHCAGNAAEGITAAVRHRPDVILLDINLPDMPGTEVFLRLKADPRTSDIPCVAVSADALPDQIHHVQALGFVDYWTKPLDLPTTIGKLKSLLRY